MKPFIRQFLFLILAGTIIALGFITTILKFSSNNPVNSREYLSLHTESVLVLKPGKYSIFYEYEESKQQYGPVQIIRNNRISNLSDWLSVTVRNNSDTIIMVEDVSMTYSINQIKGESLYSFSVENEEQYHITVQIRDTNLNDSLKFTLVADFSKGIISLFKNLGVYLLMSIPFLIAGLIIYWREEKKKRIGRTS